MNIEDLTKEVEKIEAKSDFVVSWWAKKYKKTIRRLGTLNKEGCRVLGTRWQKIYVFLGRCN